jgi:para-aminobenzoate synthetase component 1
MRSRDHIVNPVVTISPPGAPPLWTGPRLELERWEWRTGDPGDPADGLAAFLSAHGLAAEPGRHRGTTTVALLIGAVGAAHVAGLPAGGCSPVPAVPEIAAIALGPGSGAVPRSSASRPAPVGHWSPSWTDGEHAAAVEVVRSAIARGELYQANVVGHRSARHRGRPRDLAAAVAVLPGATYGGVLEGAGWAVGCASPEQLVRLRGGRLTTVPIKGTLPVAPGSRELLLASDKDRAEHVMIVDLERNDLSRVARTGSVEVESLFELVDWSGLWQATSTVAAELADGATTWDVLRALLPGGSVTGAPKRAACQLLAGLEPVGRGPSMGALGLLWPGGLDLGLTIRTVGVDEDSIHLWAGGGITWGSDPVEEVAEAHAKAGPVLAALGGPARCR